MPVRFRCAYCNQLMGISHRKVGAVVRCPKCAGQVVVPEAAPEETHDPAELAPANDPNKALEDPELELLLAGAAKEAATGPKPKLKRKSVLKPMMEIDVEPFDPPVVLPPTMEPQPPMPEPRSVAETPSANSAGVLLPRSALAIAAALLLVLMGLAFLVGFLLGKQSVA